MHDHPEHQGRAARRSSTHQTLTILYALGLLPVSLLTLLIAVLAVSPTTCPETGDSFLCRSDSAGSLVLGSVALLLLTAVAASWTAVGTRRTRAGNVALLASGGSADGAALLALTSAASWG